MVKDPTTLSTHVRNVQITYDFLKDSGVSQLSIKYNLSTAMIRTIIRKTARSVRYYMKTLHRDEHLKFNPKYYNPSDILLEKDLYIELFDEYMTMSTYLSMVKS